MYVRKNKVRSGQSHRVYIAIAHNVWYRVEGRQRGQSRPRVLLPLGVAEEVDPARAAILAEVLTVAVPMDDDKGACHDGWVRKVRRRLHDCRGELAALVSVHPGANVTSAADEEALKIEFTRVIERSFERYDANLAVQERRRELHMTMAMAAE